MKTYEHKFKYQAWPSACKVYIKEMDFVTWICFESTQSGTSVTNASEQLATEIVAKENLDPNQCRFFECYPEYEGTVDEITYSWEEGKASRPNWKTFTNKEANPFYQ